MTYDATVDTVMGEDDEVIMADGAIKVVSDARSSLFLDGLTIDYSNDLIQAGFRLSNNNASESCGCGASFAV
jgi:iron-sulfur cluster assembly protein